MPAYMCVCPYFYICIHAIDHWQVVEHCIFFVGVCGRKSLHLLVLLALWWLPCAPDLLCPISQLSFQYVPVCAQLGPTLCNPLDCSLPGSSVDGISQQEYWSGLPFPPPGNLPNPGNQPRSPALAGRLFTTEPPGTWIIITLHVVAVNIKWYHSFESSKQCPIHRKCSV